MQQILVDCLLGARYPAYLEGTPENKTGTLLAFMTLSAVGKTRLERRRQEERHRLQTFKES